jgi:hypothetical protein
LIEPAEVMRRKKIELSANARTKKVRILAWLLGLVSIECFFYFHESFADTNNHIPIPLLRAVGGETKQQRGVKQPSSVVWVPLAGGEGGVRTAASGPSRPIGVT